MKNFREKLSRCEINIFVSNRRETLSALAVGFLMISFDFVIVSCFKNFFLEISISSVCLIDIMTRFLLIDWWTMIWQPNLIWSWSRLEGFLEAFSFVLEKLKNQNRLFVIFSCFQSVVVNWAIYAHNQFQQNMKAKFFERTSNVLMNYRCSLYTILQSLIYSKFNNFTQYLRRSHRKMQILWSQLNFIRIALCTRPCTGTSFHVKLHYCTTTALRMSYKLQRLLMEITAEWQNVEHNFNF